VEPAGIEPVAADVLNDVNNAFASNNRNTMLNLADDLDADNNLAARSDRAFAQRRYCTGPSAAARGGRARALAPPWRFFDPATLDSGLLARLTGGYVAGAEG
jgi:hypothetical protein